MLLIPTDVAEAALKLLHNSGLVTDVPPTDTVVGTFGMLLAYPMEEPELQAIEESIVSAINGYLGAAVGNFDARSHAVTSLAQAFEAFIRKILIVKTPNKTTWTSNTWSCISKGIIYHDRVNPFLEIEVSAYRNLKSPDEYISYVRELRNRGAHGATRLAPWSIDQAFYVVLGALLGACCDEDVVSKLEALPHPTLTPRGRFGAVLKRYYRTCATASTTEYTHYTDLEAMAAKSQQTYWLEAKVRSLSNSDSTLDYDEGLISARSLLDNNDNIFILGPAGTGKTTLLQTFTTELGQAFLQEEHPWPSHPPVLTRLSSLQEDILHVLSRTLGLTSADTIDFLSAGPTLLLDGLDEMTVTGRTHLIQSIYELTQTHNKLRFVISSRPHGFKNQLRWKAYELMPLTHARSHHLAENLLGATLAGRLCQHDTGWLSTMFRNPLFLSLLCRVYAREGRLPSDYFDLYSSFTNDVLERESTKPGATSTETLIAALEYVASTANTLGATTIPISDRVSKDLKGIGITDGESLPLLVSNTSSQWFIHKSFQAYFGSRVLSRNLSMLDSESITDEWLDCLPFLRLAPDNATELSRTLMSRHLYLAATVVLSTNADSPESIRLLTTIADNALPDELVEIANELSSWDRSLVLDVFVRILLRPYNEDTLFAQHPGFEDAICNVLRRSAIGKDACQWFLVNGDNCGVRFRDVITLTGKTNPDFWLKAISLGASDFFHIIDDKCNLRENPSRFASVIAAMRTSFWHSAAVEFTEEDARALRASLWNMVNSTSLWESHYPGKGKPKDQEGRMNALRSAGAIGLSRLRLGDERETLLSLVAQLPNFNRTAQDEVVAALPRLRPDGWLAMLSELRQTGERHVRIAASRALGWHKFSDYYDTFANDLTSTNRDVVDAAMAGLRASRHPKALTLLKATSHHPTTPTPPPNHTDNFATPEPAPATSAIATTHEPDFRIEEGDVAQVMTGPYAGEFCTIDKLYEGKARVRIQGRAVLLDLVKIRLQSGQRKNDIAPQRP